MKHKKNFFSKIKSLKIRQWGWFVALWLGGLLAVALLTYPLKILMKMQIAS